MRAIDADKLYKFSEVLQNYCLEHHYRYITITQLADIIKKCPVYEVERTNHSHWIDTGSGEECASCHEIQYGYDSGRNYCANCGAIMDLVVF